VTQRDYQCLDSLYSPFRVFLFDILCWYRTDDSRETRKSRRKVKIIRVTPDTYFSLNLQSWTSGIIDLELITVKLENLFDWETIEVRFREITSSQICTRLDK